MEENAGNVYGGFSDRSRAHSGGTNSNPVWNLWATNHSTIFTAAADTTTSIYPPASAYQTLYSSHGGDNGDYEQLSLYNGGREGSHLYPDPHLMCLKLGKRHYFGDNFPVSSEREVGGGDQLSIGKRIKPYCGGHVGTSSPVAVPRCQVEGCHVGLVNAKDYHRRHKVCEMHSKAPKVVVLGLDQRFCQQCSRFHVVSEFDESKRSCRRRLAGHNERRRKTSHESVPRNYCHDQFIPYGTSPTSGAHSLLSSKAGCWNISCSDISSRSSAALRELIAENRASILSRHLQHNQQLPHHDDQSYNYHQFSADPNTNWDRFQENGTQGAAVTLDLMQASTASAFGFLSTSRAKDKEDEVECSVLWNAWTGVHDD